jgi:hypothetical protein
MATMSVRPQVMLVGGIGKLERHYREAAEQCGLDLLYCEKKVVNAQNLKLIMVVASVISHPLRRSAERCARDARCPIIYLRQPSIAMVRRAMEEATDEHSNE